MRDRTPRAHEKTAQARGSDAVRFLAPKRVAQRIVSNMRRLFAADRTLIDILTVLRTCIGQSESKTPAIKKGPLGSYRNQADPGRSLESTRSLL
jgi:hypothetical protein